MTLCAAPLSNKIVMNKYIWMSRQLRNINDVGSIINWTNAMLLVKSLLFDPVPISSAADTLQSALLRTTPQLTTQNMFNSQRPHPELSINRPTIITIQPLKKTLLTTSPSRCSSHVLPKPSHLTINTHCQPTIPPINSQAPSSKRRKISIPPAVDYHASSTNLTDSKSSSLNALTDTATCTSTSNTKISHDPPQVKRCIHCWEKRKECFCRRFEKMTPLQQKKCFEIT